MKPGRDNLEDQYFYHHLLMDDDDDETFECERDESDPGKDDTRYKQRNPAADTSSGVGKEKAVNAPFYSDPVEMANLRSGLQYLLIVVVLILIPWIVISMQIR